VTCKHVSLRGRTTRAGGSQRGEIGEPVDSHEQICLSQHGPDHVDNPSRATVVAMGISWLA
jgi:hypothetical protein